MENIRKQIRTCVCCRSKFSQSELLRLQCENATLVAYTKKNRSFYLCMDCITDSKLVVKSLYRQCKNKADYKQQLEEIVQIWKTK